MTSCRVDIISIGCLSRNLLWKETAPVRTPHATTTLVRGGGKSILIDPGLPPTILAARLHERTGLRPAQIDMVFLTNFRPAHRAGLPAFDNATWFIHENEAAAAREQLESLIDQAPAEDIDRRMMEDEISLLREFEPAPDKLCSGVDLFPLFGYSPGTCGLLITAPTLTTLIAGDAAATLDHFLAGQVLPDSADIQQAQEALVEIYDIADVVVPGHDNVFINPRMSGM